MCESRLFRVGPASWRTGVRGRYSSRDCPFSPHFLRVPGPGHSAGFWGQADWLCPQRVRSGVNPGWCGHRAPSRANCPAWGGRGTEPAGPEGQQGAGGPGDLAPQVALRVVASGVAALPRGIRHTRGGLWKGGFWPLSRRLSARAQAPRKRFRVLWPYPDRAEPQTFSQGPGARRPRSGCRRGFPQGLLLRTAIFPRVPALPSARCPCGYLAVCRAQCSVIWG